jgi:adenosylcobyric acid synthase
MGRRYADADARSYQDLKPVLREAVLDALADLRARYDVVVCEGAGSPAEINLRAGDLANMGLARAADIPVVLVGDIDRGGVFASLYGSLALLEPDDQALVAGFVINKFRGDDTILAPGLEQLHALTGRPTLGVLPWLEGMWLDAEDSLALEAPRPEAVAALGGDTLEVAVVRLRWMSNFTDVDALTAEPGVSVRFTRSPADVERADLVLVPGTKATVEDLERLRAGGLDEALARRAAAGDPILGVCGGYQMLGEAIEDEVESRRGTVAGLGLLPVRTRFAVDKRLRRVSGTVALAGGAPATGYEIRHGEPSRHGGEAIIDDGSAAGEGCAVGAVLGTSWHGLLEGDAVRRGLLAWVAARRGRRWLAGTEPFAAVRERHLDRLGSLISEHVDVAALEAVIEGGAPAGLPVVESGLVGRVP